MERVHRRILVVLIICLFFSISNKVQAGNNGIEIVELVNTEVSNLIDEKLIKGAVVSIVKGDQVLLSKGYGFADEEINLKADGENTAFRIGSLSKTFVALAAMQLEEKDRLDLNAPITKYLEPDFPKFKYPITMKDLLTHTAGFEYAASGMVAFDQSNVKSLRTVVRDYRPNQVFKPGEVQAYSNYGIALAGYVIEKITKQNFCDYAEENIFKPLEMTNTTLKLDSSPAPYLSKGYGADGNERMDYTANIYPAGSATSTALDISKYMIFLMNTGSDILGSEAKAEMFEHQFSMANEFAGIGYIWNRNLRNNTLYFDKKGETRNFFSRIMLYPDQKTGIFISFNSVTPEKVKEDFMNKITDELLGIEGEKVIYTGKDLKDISGYYVSTLTPFETAEKFINVIVPQRTIHISGNPTKGFMLNGEKLIPIGKNYYSSELGYIKFVEKDGNSYLSNNTSSYIPTQWYVYRGWQGPAVLVFAALSLSVFVTSIGLFIIAPKKGDAKKRLSILSSAPGIIMFPLIALICLESLAMAEVNLEGLISMLKVEAILIFLVGLLGTLSTIHFWRKKYNILLCSLFLIWNIASLVFALWLYQVNLLFS